MPGWSDIHPRKDDRFVVVRALSGSLSDGLAAPNSSRAATIRSDPQDDGRQSKVGFSSR
jgi:hypothetical protein